MAMTDPYGHTCLSSKAEYKATKVMNMAMYNIVGTKFSQNMAKLPSILPGGTHPRAMNNLATQAADFIVIRGWLSCVNQEIQVKLAPIYIA